VRTRARKGKRIALSNGRRLVDDITQIARKIPSAGICGDFELGKVDQLRRQTRPKLSWNVIYLKAYALVAERIAPLNQLYVGFPWPHLYQHGSIVCMMTVNRQHAGEDRLFFARFNNPQHDSLTMLQQKYDSFRQTPVEEIRQFRHQIRFSKAPWLLRKLGWWVLFNLWPSKRASHVGTIGMSFSGYRGIYGNQHLGPMTSILGIDPFPKKGSAHLVFTFDHRVVDGLPAATTLHQIYQTVENEIWLEMQSMVRAQAVSERACDQTQAA
jgi:hypothetical protein